MNFILHYLTHYNKQHILSSKYTRQQWLNLYHQINKYVYYIIWYGIILYYTIWTALPVGLLSLTTLRMGTAARIPRGLSAPQAASFKVGWTSSPPPRTSCRSSLWKTCSLHRTHSCAASFTVPSTFWLMTLSEFNLELTYKHCFVCSPYVSIII